MTYRFNFTVIIALLLLSSTARAAILRVNNTSGSSAPYTTLSSAVAAAFSGDTLHIEGSATAYTDLSFNKRLVIIGPGYFLDEEYPNPNTQYNKNNAAVINVTFQAGSKGSIVMGLEIRNSLAVNDSFITLQRNLLHNAIVNVAYSRPVYGDTLRNNFFRGISRINNSGSFSARGLMVYNNIFLPGYYADVIYISTLSTTSGYFINNSVTSNGAARFKCSNFTFQNNIFDIADFGSLATSNIFLNNIAYSGIPASGGDTVGVNMSDVYVGWPGTGSHSSDAKFKLQEDALAAGYGILAGTFVDCGAFGGPASYILSGMPPVPSVYELSAPETVGTGTTEITISVSATSEH